MTLELPWAADAKDEIQERIVALRGWLLVVLICRTQPSGYHASPTSGSSSANTSCGRKSSRVIRRRPRQRSEDHREQTYQFLDRVLVVMGKADAPVNAKELVAEALQPWADKPRTRQLCVDAIHRLLEFAVDEDLLSDDSWSLSDRKRKKLRGSKPKRQKVATPTDEEILELLASFPNTDSGRRWYNAVSAIALFGLRPCEIEMLTPRPHPLKATPQVFCDYENPAASM